MKPTQAEPANRSRVLPLEHVEHKVDLRRLQKSARRSRLMRWLLGRFKPGRRYRWL